MRKAFLMLVIAGIFSVPTRAHACYGLDPHRILPDGTVCGYVQRIGFNGFNTVVKPAAASWVKICPAGVSPNDFRCRTVMATSHQDPFGNTIQSFIFFEFGRSFQSAQSFDFYTWGYFNDYWGSTTVPVYTNSIDRYGLEEISLYQRPRPLEPTPVYPAGNSVGDAYMVRWKSGIDTDRKPYSANYEVWFKYWPFGDSEPANWSLSRANMPCQDNGGGPDVLGECSTYVAGPQPAGNWRWYVVANFNMSAYYSPNTFFTTQSPPQDFIQP